MNNSDLLESFNNLGYAKIDAFFSKDDLQKIETEYQIFVKNEAPNLRGKDINYVDKEKTIINSIHKLALHPGQYFFELLHSARMKNLAEIFLSGEARPRRAEMFAKPADKGLKSPIHQDNFYWCLSPFEVGTALTLWVALDHCSEENGGLSYLIGSHKKGILEHVNSYAPGSSQTIKDRESLSEYRVVTPVLNPGDILIHDAHTAHFSSDNLSGRSRRGMTLQYQSAKAILDKDMYTHYQAELNRQVELREKININSKAD